MLLVINEWWFHDLMLENGEDSFIATAKFLAALQRSSDRVVWPDEKRWNHKAYQLMRMIDPQQRVISQRLHRFLRDSDRTIRCFDNDKPSISETLTGRVPDRDIYLVSAYVSVGADILVTTDNELFDILKECDNVNCQMRDPFLGEYLR